MRSGAVVMAWNVFRFCTALRGLGSLMILIVFGIVGVSYYAVVVAIYGPSLLTSGWLDSLLAVAVLVPFHLLVLDAPPRSPFPASICGGRCVLKMDHHCVWVVNCVGALNYKFFLLFLVSSLVPISYSIMVICFWHSYQTKLLVHWQFYKRLPLLMLLD
ncbi:hypothetical protein B296_00055311 [Ensete ventricosum]|uniref:S-acyltransferase n=1 Tax=Ensete ventricosum TaxID=4639 RepID=A0A426Y0C3_ENSVE|nr:hypothetical protein B296_00055311 [Ensete ventricosum]